MSRGGSGRRPSAVVPPSRHASIGLGLNPSSLGKPSANFSGMGRFTTMGAGNKRSSKERYASSNCAASVRGAAGLEYASNWPSTLQRTMLAHHCRNTSAASVERTETRTTGFLPGLELRVMALALIITCNDSHIDVNNTSHLLC